MVGNECMAAVDGLRETMWEDRRETDGVSAEKGVAVKRTKFWTARSVRSQTNADKYREEEREMRLGCK